MSILATVLIAGAGFLGLNFLTSFIVNSLILPVSILIAALAAYRLYQFDPLDAETGLAIYIYSVIGVGIAAVLNMFLQKIAGTLSNFLTLIFGIIIILFVFRPDFLGSIVGQVINN